MGSAPARAPDRYKLLTCLSPNETPAETGLDAADTNIFSRGQSDRGIRALAMFGCALKQVPLPSPCVLVASGSSCTVATGPGRRNRKGHRRPLVAPPGAVLTESVTPL